MRVSSGVCDKKRELGLTRFGYTRKAIPPKGFPLEEEKKKNKIRTRVRQKRGVAVARRGTISTLFVDPL